MSKKILHSSLLGAALIILSACSSFTGIRTPKYDGQPFVAQADKITAFEEHSEIIGEEKTYYIPETFSEDILNPGLEAGDHEPVLLEEGTYIIGEDLPAGRVSLIGEKENPRESFDMTTDPNSPPEPENYKVGTMTIRDETGAFYFENMFHPFYGVMLAQVDFIAGHTIEIVGSQPEIVVFYAEELPNDPYVFDTRAEEFYAQFEDMEELGESSEFEEPPVFEYEQEQPLKVSEDGRVVELKAGIYEVGKHFSPGTYEITQQSSPTHTEIFLFSESAEPRVFESSKNMYWYSFGWDQYHEGDFNPEELPIIELTTGDKIYPHYINHLVLTKISE